MKCQVLFSDIPRKEDFPRKQDLTFHANCLQESNGDNLHKMSNPVF